MSLTKCDDFKSFFENLDFISELAFIADLTSHLNHLKKICRLFDQEDNNHPILLKLQREFCIDLTSFEKGTPVRQNKEVYF